MCERIIAAHGRTGKCRGNGSKHLAAVRTQQPERIVQHQIAEEVRQVIGMLSIETVALPVSQHRGVNLHVLQQARLVVIAHGVHERALARHTVIVQLVRDKRGLVRTTVHGKIEDLVLAIFNGFVEHDPVTQQKLTLAGGAPCKGARCFLKQQVRAIAFKRHIARAQNIVKPRIPRLQRIRIRAKGQNVATIDAVDAAMPALRALDRPPFSLSTSLKRASFSQ